MEMLSQVDSKVRGQFSVRPGGQCSLECSRSPCFHLYRHSLALGCDCKLGFLGKGHGISEEKYITMNPPKNSGERTDGRGEEWRVIYGVPALAWTMTSREYDDLDNVLLRK